MPYLILIIVGLITLWLLIGYSLKGKKEVIFSDKFYNQVEYFKLDNNEVIAVMINNDKKIVYKSRRSNDVQEYFNSIQENYKKWLDKNSKIKNKLDGAVKFS